MYVNNIEHNILYQNDAATKFGGECAEVRFLGRRVSHVAAVAQSGRSGSEETVVKTQATPGGKRKNSLIVGLGLYPGSSPGSCIIPMKTTYHNVGQNSMVSKSVKIGMRYGA